MAAASSSDTKELPPADKVFQYDGAAMDKLLNDKPWLSNVKYFDKVRISALAAMKMLEHALAGVEKGRKAGSNPIEVMGLLVGKPDGRTIVVMDCYAIPVEGTETKVVADDAQNYMLALGDRLEQRREERFIGWYHSHPFDVGTHSHCHLSGTDVQTQYTWQAGLPLWCAIVVDPLRSIARQEPEFGCYRCYPLDYNPPKNLCPDGTTQSNEKARIERWGMSYHRYYQLEHSYFMSSLGHNLLKVMSRNSLWIRTLGSSAILEQETRDQFADRVKNVTKLLDSASSATSGAPASGRGAARKPTRDLEQGALLACDLALEQVKGHITQVSKDVLFNQVEPAASDQPMEAADSKSNS